jgi:hypothetical protein
MEMEQRYQAGKRMGSQMQECIQACTTCHAVCSETIQQCLQMGGKHAEASHMRVLMDCAQICQTSADFMLRGSELHTSTCGVCAEVCTRCADDCDRFGDDAMMQRCAETCRTCAHSCGEMAGSGQGHMGHMGERM